MAPGAPSFHARKGDRLGGRAFRWQRRTGKRKRQTKPGAVPPVGSLLELDDSAMDSRIFASDRKAKTGTLHPSFRGRGALVERLEDPFAVVDRHPRPLVHHIEYRAAILAMHDEPDGARSRRILDRVGHEVVDDRADLFRVADHKRGLQLGIE